MNPNSKYSDKVSLTQSLFSAEVAVLLFGSMIEGGIFLKGILNPYLITDLSQAGVFNVSQKEA